MSALSAILDRHASSKPTSAADRACDLLAIVFIALALWTGMHAVSGLQWPYDPDHFRDIAFAQTALDGHPLSDASYPGEWIWYNPLLPWLVAFLSWVVHQGPTLVDVAAGPFVNLLGPVAFYVVAARVAGRPAALAALAFSLFMLCREDCWACATYSPWLFTSTFAQGLFYTALGALLWAGRRDSLGPAAIAGVAVGATFLAHTAPALLLAPLGFVLLKPRRLLLCGAVAAVVCTPFVVSLVGHYHLRILNYAPMQWHYGPLMPAALAGTLRTNWMWLAGAAVGLAWLRSRVLVTWLVTAALLLGFSMTDTPVVPAFHFWIYLMAAVVLLCGVALARVLRTPWALMAVVCALVVWHWPEYTARQDFTLTRALAIGRNPDFAKMSASLRRLSRPEEVVLGTYGAANLIIGPAGRKVVAPHPFMGNPYVAIEPRATERDAMLKAVQQHDVGTFQQLAQRYQVALMMSVGDAECGAAESFPLLAEVQRHGIVCLARVRTNGVSSAQ